MHARLLGIEEREFTPSERSKVEIRKDRIYRHRRLRINFTTYDVRRAQDSVNPKKRRDVMVLSNNRDDDAHPYWYARVLGIFHCTVRHHSLEGASRDWQRVEFLWVRWYTDPVDVWGWKAKRLPRVSFVPHDRPDAFGFINPANVIRGAHIIPAFVHGRTSTLLASPSIARAHGRDEEDEENDWASAYVNMYVISTRSLLCAESACSSHICIRFVD